MLFYIEEIVIDINYFNDKALALDFTTLSFYEFWSSCPILCSQDSLQQHKFSALSLTLLLRLLIFLCSLSMMLLYSLFNKLWLISTFSSSSLHNAPCLLKFLECFYFLLLSITSSLPTRIIRGSLNTILHVSISQQLF